MCSVRSVKEMKVALFCGQSGSWSIARHHQNNEIERVAKGREVRLNASATIVERERERGRENVKE